MARLALRLESERAIGAATGGAAGSTPGLPRPPATFGDADGSGASGGANGGAGGSGTGGRGDSRRR
jgi:hypothetical protein